MALKFGKLFGGEKVKSLGEVELDMPTTQVKMAQGAQTGYDPLASVSIMEQLRTATASMQMPKKLPLIGNLPVVKQFQTLGALMVVFLLFAALMVYLDNRQSAQGAAASATATEMQMLSQRLARGSALAAQGQAGAFAAVKDSRERFKTDLDALVSGGSSRGVSLDTAQDDATLKLLSDVKARWERDCCANRCSSRICASLTTSSCFLGRPRGLAMRHQSIAQVFMQAIYDSID